MVYGPCTEPDRSNFITWFSAHQIADDDNWLFLGDFNFYRSLQDQNREGGNLQDTLIFSEAIGELGLVELPLKGKAYTWSNMQANPLLGQLDWFFSSVNWTQSYPNTLVLPMAKITSDHIPCKVMIDTKIPRSNIFRFENFWTQHDGFMELVQDTCNRLTNKTDAAVFLTEKSKALDMPFGSGARVYLTSKV